MLSTIDLWLTELRLKLCLLALPVYVWPKERLLSYKRRISHQDQPALDHTIANGTIRWLSTMLSTKQFRALTHSSSSIHDTITASPMLKEIHAESREIQEVGFRGTFVITTPLSTHLILYIHGGGFVSGSSAECSKYLLQLFLEVRQRGIVCDILSVDYELSPNAIYPTAMRQIIHAYRYAAALNKPIILMGDSAGGNLCLGLLQHLAVPNAIFERAPQPEITKQDSTCIVATCLLSPWVNLRTEGSSVHAYRQFDCVDKLQLDQWARAYLGPSGALNCYNNPIDREKSWKSILTQKTLFMAGGMELFLSDILSLADRIREDNCEHLEVIVTPNKCHAWSAVDYGFGCASKAVDVAIEEPENDSSPLFGLRTQANWIVGAIAG